MLEIRKFAGNVWEHTDTAKNNEFLASQFYAEIVNEKFQIIKYNGSTTNLYNVSDVRVYDIGGSAESFANGLALFQRLKALNYTAFQEVPDTNDQFWEVVAGNLRNKDNSFNFLLRFLAEKGFTIEVPTNATNWNIFRLMRNGIEQARMTDNGILFARSLSAIDVVEATNAIRWGSGILHTLSFVQFANSLGGNVRNALLGSTGYTASGGGGMLEAPFLSTDPATLARPNRYTVKSELDAGSALMPKLVDLWTGAGATPITGTTAETLVRTIPIPAGTLKAIDYLKILYRANCVGTVGVKTTRLRINTSNSFNTSLQLLATHQASAATLLKPLVRTFRLNGGNLFGFAFNVSSPTDEVISGNGGTSTTFDPNTNYWIFISEQLGNSADSVTASYNEMYRS